MPHMRRFPKLSELIPGPPPKPKSSDELLAIALQWDRVLNL